MNNQSKSLDQYQECRERTLELLRVATNETVEQQINRYMNEAYYSAVVEHITQMYHLIATNKHFQQEQKVIQARLERLLNQSLPSGNALLIKQSLLSPIFGENLEHDED